MLRMVPPFSLPLSRPRTGLAVCVKHGYVLVAKWAVGDNPRAGQLLAIDDIAIGFYWACGECTQLQGHGALVGR